MKGERDIRLIKILAFPVAMRFIVYRYEDSVKMMFLASQRLYCAQWALESTAFLHVYTLTKVYAEEHMLLLCMQGGTHICFRC